MAAPAPASAPHFYVAGPADDEDFAKAEHLAELLMSSLPGVSCRIIPVLPEQWPDYLGRLQARLGCPGRQPLIWTGTGKAIGGIFDFEQIVDIKYGIRLEETPHETWKKIAESNIAALRLKVSGMLPGLAPSGSGGERGSTVAEALMMGHERYLAGKPGVPYEAPGLMAAVVTIGELPAPVYKMLDCPDTGVVVVRCGAFGVDAKVASAVEQIVFGGGCRTVFIIGAATPELTLGLEGAAAHLAVADAPLPAAERAIVDRMLPALARVLSVALPSCTQEEKAELALEEWVREAQDDLLTESPVLAELFSRQGIHFARCACSGGTLRQL